MGESRLRRSRCFPSDLRPWPFEVVETQIELPDQLDRALASPPVQAAIEKTLIDFLRTTPTSDTGVMSGTEATKLVGALFSLRRPVHRRGRG
jgi:hypothetical protein